MFHKGIICYINYIKSLTFNILSGNRLRHDMFERFFIVLK